MKFTNVVLRCVANFTKSLQAAVVEAAAVGNHVLIKRQT
jgi:hypothetical protein